MCHHSTTERLGLDNFDKLALNKPNTLSKAILHKRE